jgi:hypothetical protein
VAEVVVETIAAASTNTPEESPIAKRFKNRSKTLKERIAEAPETRK